MNELIRQRQEQMEHSSLSVKEEKAALQEMKRMKEDAKRYLEWETELDGMKHKRAVCAEQLRLGFEQLDEQRNIAFRVEAASALSMPVEMLEESKLSVGEEMQELLSSLLWRKRLASECAVHIRMDRGARRGVIVAGSGAAVLSAKALVESIGPVSVLKKVLDEEQQGLLIGKRGATIAQLQEETGCSLEIKRNTGTLTIAGPSAQVRATEELIEELLRDQRRVEVTLKFDLEQKGTLLGKHGTTINRIQQESAGAQLEVSRGDECTIRIWGPSAAVAKARSSLVALLYLDAKSVQVVEVPSELIDVVIGRGGEKLKRMEEEHGVRVDSSKSNDRTEPSKLKFRGTVEGVKAAVAQVRGMIERERRVEEVVQVESQHIGLLLGAKGSTINAIQQESGAVVDVQKRDVAAGSKLTGSQAVTVRGNSAAVKKALAALEAVLQYNAECTEEVAVSAAMMPLLIGRGGEEINRIRLETGAAIDGERYDKEKNSKDDKPTLKLRGTKEAVEKAAALIRASVEAHKTVSESAVLPWHAIDAIVGPNGAKLRELESAHGVTIVLPGQDIMSDQVGLGSGLISIATSMTLRGRKKHVDALVAQIDELSMKNLTEELHLDDGDADLLASLCLSDENLLANLETEWGVKLDFEPRAGTLTMRGERTVEAQRELKTRLNAERFTEEVIDCPTAQYEYLTADDAVIESLQQLCAPGLLTVQELPHTAIVLLAPFRLLPDVVVSARGWLDDHAPREATLRVPPEVVSIMRSQLNTRAAEWRVALKLPSAGKGAGAPGAATLHLSGPSRLVRLAEAAAAEIVRQHAHLEERVALSGAEYALVGVLLTKREASGGRERRNSGASETPNGSAGAAAGAASLFDGVESFLESGYDAKTDADGQLVLRGKAPAVTAVKERLAALLADAESSTTSVPVSAVQISKLNERKYRGSDSVSLKRRLQETHLCALLVDRDAMTLQVFGAASSTKRLVALLETELDVDEHSREVAERLVPIIIGRGGSNIKKLSADSGALFDLDRATQRVSVRGTKAQVVKAVAMLDDLVGAFGEEEMSVPARQLGVLIGRGGQTIKQLQSDSGATIDIRKEEDIVRVRGPQPAVEKAMVLIRELLSAQGNRGGGPAAAPAAAPAGGEDGGGAPPGLGRASGAPPGLSSSASAPGPA